MISPMSKGSEKVLSDHAVTPDDLDVIDLGRMAYGPAMAFQRSIHRGVADGGAPPTLLMVEHDPVITISRRRSATTHLRAELRELNHLGIDVHETDRGGDITYHGPGQLVVYPILPLGPLRLSIGRYLRWIEQVVIDTVAGFSVRAFRLERFTGVWIDAPNDRGEIEEGRCAKLCAVGVRVERGVTLHGAALNVTTRMEHFQTIVPCGLANRPVTSLQQVLGDRTPTMDRVKQELADAVRHQLGLREVNHGPSPATIET